jgi:hypothetical protein
MDSATCSERISLECLGKDLKMDEMHFEPVLKVPQPVYTEVLKLNLRYRGPAVCDDIEEIRKRKPKIWLMHYKATSSVGPITEYSLLWVERGRYTEKERTRQITELLLQSRPPEELTLNDFKFLTGFMNEEEAKEIFIE